MPNTFQVLLGDAARPAESSFYNLLQSLEIEENADLPGAIQLTLPITPQGAPGHEDLTVLGDAHLQPYARIAVVVRVEGERDACIFDGYVLAHKIHLDRGTTTSSVQVWGQDAMCLMNLEEKTRERPGTDGNTANSIFGDYHFETADENTADDSPDYQLENHVLIQRGTDAQFLRERARRAGRLFRVCCGERPGENKGYFIKPNLDAAAVKTLALNPIGAANVESLDFEWDVTRPTEVMANALVSSKDPVDGGAAQSGLSLLDARSLAAFAGANVMKTRLTATVDDAGELRGRAEALLREAAWFVKCEGEADLARLQFVLRVGTIVQVNGAGKLHSGKYFVWSVRHTITPASHRMRFVLIRNAVGDT